MTATALELNNALLSDKFSATKWFELAVLGRFLRMINTLTVCSDLTIRVARDAAVLPILGRFKKISRSSSTYGRVEI